MLLPIVFGKGSGEAQKFSWLVEHDEIYLVGAERRLQRGEWVQGRALPRREIEKLCGWGKRRKIRVYWEAQKTLK